MIELMFALSQFALAGGFFLGAWKILFLIVDYRVKKVTEEFLKETNQVMEA